MDAFQIAEIKINTFISKVFNYNEYSSFLSFSSRFLNFNYKNIILIYLQDPEAKYVAGINAWKELTGLTIKKGSKPILVLYPSLDNGCLKYSIKKVFDYRCVDNDNISKIDIQKELVVKCDKDKVLDGLINFLESQEYTVYPASDNSKDVKINSHNIITFGNTLTYEEKITQILEVFMRTQIKNPSPIVTGAIINSIVYIIGTYYGIDVSRLNFKYVNLPVITENDKREILKHAINYSKKIVDSINSSQK